MPDTTKILMLVAIAAVVLVILWFVIFKTSMGKSISGKAADTSPETPTESRGISGSLKK